MQLSELQSRILAVLQEACEENGPALLNTIISPQGSVGELADYATAVHDMIDKGLVLLAIDLNESRRLRPLDVETSHNQFDLLRANLSFDSERRLWTDKRRHGPPYPVPYPYIVTTHVGMKFATDIVSTRGEVWWR